MKKLVTLSVLVLMAALVQQANASDYFSDVPFDHWASNAVERMYRLEVIKGDQDSNTFRPNDPMTRAETTVVVDRLNEQLQDYVDQQVREKTKQALMAFKAVLESPVHQLTSNEPGEDWSTFKNETLGLQFQLPGLDTSCQVSEVDVSESRERFQIDELEGKKIMVSCGSDIHIAARTEIYRPYEDYYVPFGTFPEPYEMLEACFGMMTDHCKGYKLSDGGREYYFVAYLEDPNIGVGAYVPIADNSEFKTARFTTTILENDSFDDEVMEQKLSDVVNRKLDEDSLKKLENFEQSVLSAQSLE